MFTCSRGHVLPEGVGGTTLSDPEATEREDEVHRALTSSDEEKLAGCTGPYLLVQVMDLPERGTSTRGEDDSTIKNRDKDNEDEDEGSRTRRL